MIEDERVDGWDGEDDLSAWEEEQVFLDDEGHIEIGVADKVELEER